MANEILYARKVGQAKRSKIFSTFSVCVSGLFIARQHDLSEK
jgi:hypothetical protein